MKRKQCAIKEFNFSDYDFSECVDLFKKEYYAFKKGAYDFGKNLFKNFYERSDK